jgi:CubicO group peptidase (beta-lactamase class C family)
MPSSALHEAMAARVDRGELPGIVTLVARGDDVRVDAIGFTHVGGDVPMRRDTPFRITSMTKPIVAAAAMSMIEDDLLDLEEPVQRLLPELADRRVLRAYDAELDDTVPAHRPITVDDLLTFRLGWGYIAVPEVMPSVPVTRAADELELTIGPPDPRSPHDPDEWIRRFATLPLIYQPGESWNYNTGSDVLAVLLARAAGKPLGDVLRERMFEPLGMRTTGFSVPAEVAVRLPGQYSADSETGRLVENELTGPERWSSPPPFPSGAGGLISTVDDFLAFARMMLLKGVHGGTRLLSEKSVERMTTNHLTPEQIEGGGTFLGGSGWGFGLAVQVEDGEGSPGTYGWAGGYGSDWFNDPHDGVIAIALTQVSDFLWNGGMEEFARLAREER